MRDAGVGRTMKLDLLQELAALGVLSVSFSC